MNDVTPGIAGRSAIERLRARAPRREAPISIDAVSIIIDRVREGWIPLASIAAQSGLSPDDVVETVVGIGTWLGQSLNAAVDAVVCDYGSAPAPIDNVDGWDQLGLLPKSQGGVVVIPPGFERSATGRDLSKAIAQIVCADPSEAMLRRWWMRRYHRIHQVLGFDVVALVHRVAQLGRLGEIDALCERDGFNPELARVLVEAYDLLDVARLDAVAAVERLCAQPVEVSRVSQDTAEAAWLAEATFGRLAEVCAQRPEQLDDALAQLRRTVNQAPVTYQPGSIVELNDGQVRRLAEREGLRVEAAAHRDVEAVRSLVTASGMAADADLLVPAGVRAAAAGLTDSFAEALERRAEGDLAWAEDLNEALAGAGPV